VPKAGTYRITQKGFIRAEIDGRAIGEDGIELQLQAGQQLPVLLQKHKTDPNANAYATLLWSIDGQDRQTIPPRYFSPPPELGDRLIEFYRQQFATEPGGLMGEFFTDTQMKKPVRVSFEPKVSRVWTSAKQIAPELRDGFAAR